MGSCFCSTVQADLELRRFAGELRHAELVRVGEIKAEGLSGAVAVHGLLGGRHELGGAQCHGHLFHAAVRDGRAVQKALKIQCDPHPPGSGGAGGAERRMTAGKAFQFRSNGGFGHRAHPAGPAAEHLRFVPWQETSIPVSAYSPRAASQFSAT